MAIYSVTKIRSEFVKIWEDSVKHHINTEKGTKFKIGDEIIFEEYNDETNIHTGREITVEVNGVESNSRGKQLVNFKVIS